MANGVVEVSTESDPDREPQPQFTNVQRFLYWGSAVIVFLSGIAAQPEGSATDPAYSVGAAVGILVIWLLAAPTLKRAWGHEPETSEG